MGFGSTAKKLQNLVDLAERVHGRIDDVRNDLQQTTETVNETERRVEAVETELAEQRALLEALAEAQGIDAEAVTEGASADGGGERDDD